MKRSIYWILIITLLASLFPMPALALESEGTEQPVSAETQTTDMAPPPAEDTPPADSLPVETDEADTSLSPVVEPAPALSVVSSITSTKTIEVPVSPQHDGVVISQLQTSSSSNASDELIELYNNSDQVVDVTDWCLKRASATSTSYTKLACIGAEAGGKEARVTLPARSHVLTVSSVSAHIGFDLQFTAGMSDTGGRVGLYNQWDEKQDLLAWGAATVESETTPVSVLPSAGSLLQRKSVSAGAYQDTDSNAADFEIASPRSNYSYGALSDEIDFCLNLDGFQAVVPDGWSRDTVSGECVNVPVNMCSGLVLSEVGANTSSQFIELHNSGNSPLTIAGCKLQTNRSSILYTLPDITIAPQSFLSINVIDTGLTLTKTTSGTVYLLSSDGATELQSVSYEDLSEGTSWAWFGGNDWRQTYVVTPGRVNTYQQYATCETGYARNVETRRCNKTELTSALTPCKEGQYRSEETNRCRSIVSAVTGVLKPCGDDQFRNPATNRCKKIASSDDVADCGEGRERNPTTNRCRNVVQSDVPAAAFAVQPIKDSATSFVGWWALGGVASLGLGYAGWEWRREVLAILQKALAYLRIKA